jgi:hypothetical protein
VNYLTATKGITGEVISQLAPNKKGTVAFTDKQVRGGRTDRDWAVITQSIITS